MAPRHVGLLAALAAVWGGSYLLIKYALEDFEPAVIVWIRCVLAGIVLFAVIRHAPRRADLVLAAVALADRAALVVLGLHP